MGIEEGTFWDEHWVLYGNQFDNKFHILKEKEKEKILIIQAKWINLTVIIYIIKCFFSLKKKVT